MSPVTTVTAETLHRWALPGPASSDKYSRGVVLVVGGSAGTPGAVRLAGEAALRSGCGKLRIATVASTCAQLGVMMPEARIIALDEESGDIASAGSLVEVASRADAVLLGPGFVDPVKAAAVVAELAASLQGPVVLDALATAYVTAHPDLAGLTRPAVLTMNPSEVAEVLDADPSSVTDDPVGAVTRLVESSGAVVLLGGETKLVGAPYGRTFRLTAGGPGLATSGSGDVQAGLVAGLLARGAEAAQAAVWAAWLHATAGDRLARRAGSLGFLARELPEIVPRLLDELDPA